MVTQRQTVMGWKLEADTHIDPQSHKGVKRPSPSACKKHVYVTSHWEGGKVSENFACQLLKTHVFMLFSKLQGFFYYLIKEIFHLKTVDAQGNESEEAVQWLSCLGEIRLKVSNG